MKRLALVLILAACQPDDPVSTLPCDAAVETMVEDLVRASARAALEPSNGTFYQREEQRERLLRAIGAGCK